MWIEMKDKTPSDYQYVWYYFEITGVSYGQYSVEEDCFYGPRGFLTGDVTHWMEAPEPPSI